jgi:hypothetical protein
MVEQGVTQEYGVYENHGHVSDFDPLIELMFYAVAYDVKHIVDCFSKEPRNQ